MRAIEALVCIGTHLRPERVARPVFTLPLVAWRPAIEHVRMHKRQAATATFAGAACRLPPQNHQTGAAARGLTTRSTTGPATAAAVWRLQAKVGIVLPSPAGVCLRSPVSSNVRHRQHPPSMPSIRSYFHIRLCCGGALRHSQWRKPSSVRNGRAVTTASTLLGVRRKRWPQ